MTPCDQPGGPCWIGVFDRIVAGPDAMMISAAKASSPEARRNLQRVEPHLSGCERTWR
jgi:hypothetical protein